MVQESQSTGIEGTEATVSTRGREAAGGGVAAAALLLAECAPLLLRRCLCPLTTLCSVLRCQAVCRTWRRLAHDEKWLKHCVLSGGVAASERRRLWWHLARVGALQRLWEARILEEHAAKAASEVEGPQSRRSAGDGCLSAFDILARRSLPEGLLGEIERDVHRTLPTHPHFRGEHGSQGRGDLLRILRASAAAEPGVGYCQGMNFVAAVLLISLGSADDAFWMLIAMLEGYNFRCVFAPGVPLLPLRVFQFSGVVRERLPKLWRHLQNEGFSLDIFAHQSVMTLFAYSIDPDFLPHAWDVFFFVGWKAVFRMGLGLLAGLQPRLLEMTVEQISKHMHQCRRHLDHDEGDTRDVERLLCGLLQFKVSHETLDALRNDFVAQRWEALLMQVADEEATTRNCGRPPPLATGFGWSACGTGVQLEIGAFETEDLPPWRRPCSGVVKPSCFLGRPEAEPTVAARPRPLVVPLAVLSKLRDALKEFDMQTQQDVVSMRTRVVGAERRLYNLLRETEALRGEFERTSSEREERRELKQALMEALQAAVRTSPASVRNGNANHDAAHPRAPASDELVLQCLDKLNQAENGFFEAGLALRSSAEALEPAEAEISDLRETKARSMQQLSDFLTERAVARRGRLEAGIRDALVTAAEEGVGQ